jgi:hypothetical protein
MQSKVSDLVNKLNRLTALPSFPNLSSLEHDLLMQHLRDLYEELRLIRDGNAKPNEKEPEETIEPVAMIPDIKPIEVPIVKSKEPVAMKTEDKPSSTSKVSLNEVIQTPDSLHSKLKSTSAREIHHKLSTKPMKELIDLNKRYVVISELFKGDADACAKAIEQIDSSENYASAETYVRSTLFPAYQWKESSETVKLFLSLVKQKFGAE